MFALLPDKHEVSCFLLPIIGLGIGLGQLNGDGTNTETNR